MTDETPKRRGRKPKVEKPKMPEGIIRWERPTGMVLDTNDSQDTIDYAESLGWKRVE